MALSVSIGINEREAVMGVKKLGKSLSEVDQDIDDLGKNKSLDKLEGSMKDLAKEADVTGRKIGTELDSGFKKAGKGADDFKQEAQQTARESAASFDGSAESIGDAFQEVAANAFSGFGPAGAVAGIAAAAGLGAVMTALQDQAAKLEELKQKFADMYRSAAEEGRTYLSEAQIQSGVLDALYDPAKREAALKKAQLIGSDIVTVLRAEAGSREDIAVAIDLANQKAAELQAKSQEATGTTSVWAAGVQGIASDYEKLRDMLDGNAEAAKLAQESAVRGEEAHREQIQRTRDASQARYEAMAAQAANPIVQKVRVEVDDTAWRRYTPQAKSGRVNVDIWQ